MLRALSKVSMAHWNQDEAYGGFGGAHCMIKGGYGAVTDTLAKGLDVRFGVAVDAIARVDGDGDVGVWSSRPKPVRFSREARAS